MLCRTPRFPRGVAVRDSWSMPMLLSHLLNRIVGAGQLTVIDANGKTHRFGPGGSPAVTMHLHDRSLHQRLLIDPELALGEAYMEGTLTIEEGSLYDLLYICTVHVDALDHHPALRMRQRLDELGKSMQQYNPAPRAKQNVAHHYDLSDQLYDFFLDADRQYSCAYFPTGRETLDEAQQRKLIHIGAKLLLEPGMKVLDIGCGWGGLALFLARAGQVDVTGVTLSEEQLQVARKRAKAVGLTRQVHFHLRDYREETGTYDRIASVGMFEHVGVRHYDEFFTRIRRLLKEDGVALLHSIGRMTGPGTTNPWIRKYIFPGGYAPALSEVLAAIERARLWVTDVEILRLHYARTLREWSRRFAEHRAEVAALYDERFCRMWEFYLAASEISFRNLGHMVFQVQLARSVDAVPLTRDYISQWEQQHLAVAGAKPRRSLQQATR
jgi:cyclopropane-fatty-acyl-phospholipid synthase